MLFRDHKICRRILTPRRDHLLFPDVVGNKKQQPTELLPDKLNVTSGRRTKAYGILSDEIKVEKLSKGVTFDSLGGYSINKKEKNLSGKVSNVNLSSTMGFSMIVASSEWRKPNKPSKMEKIKLPGKGGQSVSTPSMKRFPDKTLVVNVPPGSTRPLRTAEMEKRIQRLLEKSSSSINVEEFLDEQRGKLAHASSAHFRVDKTITMGKVERSVQAIQAALKILQEGGTIEDAKAVCEPGVLTQMNKWKKTLGVYLAPFIHGMRYTSFGRHFTKVDKLKQVVGRLRWYVQDGDTIVDFCCGSNDFSCLMKQELDRMGRKCSFKNYDLIHPKNDFNFEKRNWMSVCPDELPEGSKLIIGLNPPYGVQAFHANQFIEKALKFRPKLLILIVPKETDRLDEKRSPYDLIWEDDNIFSGKSFYLPGSVDVHDQQMEQWNLKPPPLYLWSRPDWTNQHKVIAQEHGHLIKNQNIENAVFNYLMEETEDCYADFSSIADGYGDINCMLEDLPDDI
ncbi:protein ENHANCED DOWNY MILDEW 2 [Sesamum alatum]|uniref:Protein ENHANCED DOWNY MILDEW 2 n=1 Tax=Sesamum alatum TaxID=300844 RepID=A0AAE1YWI2_9LAMI|nr:protein ENHANCED DOWNY MILDEW 2 [Sesamum alatum]